MANTSPCCGCEVASDYGTSTVTGDGSEANPYAVSQIDPEFSRPAVKALRTFNSSQTINSGADTPVAYTATPIFDTHGMHDPVLNTRLTVPISGFYLIGADIPWGTTTAYKRAQFRLNGVTVIHQQTHVRIVSGSWTQTMQYVWGFETGDYIEVVVYHEHGSNLSVQSFDTKPCNFWAMYLGKKFNG